MIQRRCRTALYLTVACAAVLSGCYVTTRAVPARVTVAAPAPPSVSVTAPAAPEVAAGVTAVEVQCDPNLAESCNGLDDNCDGQIDEGCGYSSGDIQVTLWWATGADLDLYVTDPFGETIFYNHTQTQSGGHLDHDARGNCRPDQQNNRIENVYWPFDRPASGTYTVAVHYWVGNDNCSSGAGPTDARLSISVGGQVIGAYEVPSLYADQRVTVATFTVP